MLGACILFVDGFNTQVIGYIAPQIAKEWNIPRDELGWILAADKIGLFLGYLFVAPLSGTFGHKRLAIACIVTFGTLAGSMLPFLLKRFGFDPASASAPFVATLVDVTGLIIYFTVALLILRGTLL